MTRTTAEPSSATLTEQAHTEDRALKLRADAKELADSISVAASVAPSKSARPLLQNLLLHGHDGVLDVTGTDMEVTVRVRIERVDLQQDGKLLVNASRLQQILRELAGERLELSTDERAGCTITTPDARFHVMGEPAEDFPEASEPTDEGGSGLSLRAADLVEMIRRTHFAAHTEKTRYAMNGVLLDLKGQRLHLVATDGKRLALCERTLPEEAARPVHVVIPTRGVQLLSRLITPSDEQVQLSVEAAQVHLRTRGALVSARLVQGHFPPYEDVLPKDHDKSLKVPRDAFAGALRRAALLGTKDSLAVRFHFGREGLELTSRVPEVGESKVSLPLDYPFEELEVGFNPAYFGDVLKVLEGTEVALELKNRKSAALIREQRPDGLRSLFLVMPLDLQA